MHLFQNRPNLLDRFSLKRKYEHLSDPAIETMPTCMVDTTKS